MQDVDINYVAVIVTALVPMVLGAVWYSPALFAGPWMRAVGRREDELGGMGLGYVLSPSRQCSLNALAGSTAGPRSTTSGTARASACSCGWGSSRACSR